MSYATDEDERIRHHLAESMRANMLSKGHPEMGAGFWDSLTSSPIFKGIIGAVKHIVPFIPGVGPIASTIINGAASALGGSMKKRGRKAKILAAVPDLAAPLAIAAKKALGRPPKMKVAAGKEVAEAMAAVVPELAAVLEATAKRRRGRPAKVTGGSAYDKYMKGGSLVSVDGPTGGNMKKERGKMVSEYMKQNKCDLPTASKAVAAMSKNTV